MIFGHWIRPTGASKFSLWTDTLNHELRYIACSSEVHAICVVACFVVWAETVHLSIATGAWIIAMFAVRSPDSLEGQHAGHCRSWQSVLRWYVLPLHFLDGFLGEFLIGDPSILILEAEANLELFLVVLPLFLILPLLAAFGEDFSSSSFVFASSLAFVVSSIPQQSDEHNLRLSLQSPQAHVASSVPTMV